MTCNERRQVYTAELNQKKNKSGTSFKKCNERIQCINIGKLSHDM